MACFRISRSQLWCTVQLLLLIQTPAFCFQYRVGDLDGWNVPSAENPSVYVKWSKDHGFKIGDSLFFLYPPSQDSVIQVTKESYNGCNVKDPILEMKDGNSLFNITKPGDFYFTSGVDGHCQKSQKLHISIAGNGSYADSPASGPSAASPSYPTVFGSIPMPEAASPSSALTLLPVLMSAAIGFLVSFVAIFAEFK